MRNIRRRRTRWPPIATITQRRRKARARSAPASSSSRWPGQTGSPATVRRMMRAVASARIAAAVERHRNHVDVRTVARLQITVGRTPAARPSARPVPAIPSPISSSTVTSTATAAAAAWMDRLESSAGCRSVDREEYASATGG